MSLWSITCGATQQRTKSRKKVRRRDNLLQDSHLIPFGDAVFHEGIAGEEAADAIRNCCCDFKKKRTIVADDGNVFSLIEFG
jgi:hypothetical protein